MVMSEQMLQNHDPLQSLTQAFLLNFPLKAARRLEAMQPGEVAGVLQQQKVHVVARVMEKLAPQMSLAVLGKLEQSLAVRVLEQVDVGVALGILARLEAAERQAYLDLMSEVTAREFQSLLEYPENSVGRLMNPAVLAFNLNTTAGQAIQQLRQQQIESLHQLFLLTDDLRLHARVDLHRLLLAAPQTSLAALSVPVATVVQDMDPQEEVHDKLEHHDIDVLPVVDVEGRLVGVVEGQELRDVVRADVATDMQTMVGASRDERALSSSLFAVRKRLPWLQINLLTAFLAAAVVGMFEDTIARFTALAVLLPISAGQSGNAGAQALAVTMRGLTLREITMRHWYRVMLKEFGAGFVNGLGIAVTCSLGVYLWSRSIGLAIVMALAMVLSMTIAGISGALVPILLKRFGLDPAQSSSIVLTTVTDIAGFMSFLGIASLMSGML
jgi:magnesium transporter